MVDVVKQLAEQVVGKIAKQHEARQQLSRAEVSKLVAKANKRVARLERNNLEDSPAYQKLVNDGDVRFSVRGKDHNQLQKEVSRLNKFLESETSTVRGVNRVLKDMARNTGIKYKTLAELRLKSAKFFELSSKVEQYLRNVEDIASAIGYQKIWESINQYVQVEKVDLAESSNNIEDLSATIGKLIADHSKGLLVDEEQAVKITQDAMNDILQDVAGDTKKWWFID